ncbi:MAG: HNH endonuclease [Clostridia bacterium]|nr:HNH endonuclease [Clostridia bacterium]
MRLRIEGSGRRVRKRCGVMSRLHTRRSMDHETFSPGNIKAMRSMDDVRRATQEDRFWKYVSEQDDNTGCIEWKGAKNANGYGKLMRSNTSWLATRWIMTHAIGRSLDPRELVLHHCDNRSCVNLDHLYIGDHKKNSQDKYERGRDHSQKITHCPRGHAYTPENTYINPSCGGRKCRTCRRIMQRKDFDREHDHASKVTRP